MNLLKNTRCYLSCPMQYANSKQWTEKMAEELKKLKIKVLSPYKVNFIDELQHDEIVISLQEMKRENDKNGIYKLMQFVRRKDLRMVDVCDFIVVRIIPNIPQWGASNELFCADNQQKPIFLVHQDYSIDDVSDWLRGSFPPNYFYSSSVDVIEMLKKINNEKIKIDSPRWKLLVNKLR